MRKKRIYLDTSAISYLRQEDSPERMAETLAFWEVLKLGKYDVIISDVTVNELGKCPEPRRTELVALLEEIAYTEIETKSNMELLALSSEIRRLGVLPQKSENDRLHIAAAVFSGCNIIVSWNFHHMVNVKTIDGVRMVCLANNIAPVDRYTPVVLLERSVSDERTEPVL